MGSSETRNPRRDGRLRAGQLGIPASSRNRGGMPPAFDGIYSTSFISVPIGWMVIATLSPGSNVNSFGGTIPVPVMR